MTGSDDIESNSTSKEDTHKDDESLSLEELLTDHIGRRPFLKLGGLGTSVFLLSVLFGNGSKPAEEKIESKLSSIASQLDETNLSDPQKIRKAQNIISSELAEVEDLIDENKLPAEAAETFSSVVEYYSSLESALSNADFLTDEILDIEASLVQYDDKNISPPDMEYFELAVESFENQEDTLDSDSERVDIVTPDRQKTLREIKQLQSGYEQYIRLQQNLLEAQSAILDGVYEREQKNADAAITYFNHISGDDLDLVHEQNDFALTEYSLTLNQYKTMMSNYISASKQMKRSCKDIENPEMYDVFEDGLEHLFDSRRIIDQNY